VWNNHANSDYSLYYLFLLTSGTMDDHHFDLIYGQIFNSKPKPTPSPANSLLGKRPLSSIQALPEKKPLSKTSQPSDLTNP
jgi:hypothetical protein